jgi:hypothetical protein
MKVNDISTVTHGTHLQGYLNATYDDITETLGYPFEHGFDDMKCDAEWTIEFDDGSVATIYNWKNGKNYLGAGGLNLCDMTQWNIGGNSRHVVQMVQDLINGVARKDYPQDQVIAFNI